MGVQNKIFDLPVEMLCQ